jgi:hypothetical protein
MRSRSFRELAKWPSLLCAAIALCLVLFVRTKDVFESGTTAGMIVLAATIAAVVALILGIAAFPRWPAVVGLILLVYVAYCIIFTSMYSIT